MKMDVQFYDAGNDGATSSATAEVDKPLDLSDAIASEAAELREHSNEIFTFHKTHVNGLLYVSMAASAGELLNASLFESLAVVILMRRSLKLQMVGHLSCQKVSCIQHMQADRSPKPQNTIKLRPQLAKLLGSPAVVSWA